MDCSFTTALTRRRVAIHLIGAGAALVGLPARSAPTRVDEADESAIALGYRHDSAQVDARKFANHAADQLCIGCSFWQGQANEEWAGCSMFGRKHIAAGGWCVAWRKPG